MRLCDVLYHKKLDCADLAYNKGSFSMDLTKLGDSSVEYVRGGNRL